MIEAVVFDFDGLIRNTETFEYYSYRELLLEHGVELPLELYCTRIGGDSAAFDPYLYLQECTGVTVDREELRCMRRQKYELLIKDELTRPGVLEYLASARNLGLQIGLASSAPYSWIEYNLQELKLADCFDYICTLEDVEKVKPDPALYNKVLEHFGVLPANAIAFEDSPNGAMAAVRARMHTVIIPNEITKDLHFKEYTLRMNSMAELELEQLIAYLQK